MLQYNPNNVSVRKALPNRGMLKDVANFTELAHANGCIAIKPGTTQSEI